MYKRRRKRIGQCLLLLLTVAIISACTSTAIDRGKTLTSKPPLTDCRVIQHAMGETCVPQDPQRVVTVLHHILGQTLALDVKPIGSNVRSLEQTNGDYLNTQTYLGNKTEGIEFLGIESQVSLEKIAILKPDLILATDLTEDTYPLLTQIAPVVTVPIQDVIQNWKENFDFIAKVLGKEEQAQEAKNRYNQRIEHLKVSLSDRYRNQTISVAGGNGSNMYAFTQNSFSGSILSDLALKQPEAQQENTPYGAIYNLSEEKFEIIDGDVLFFLTFEPNGRAAFEKLQQRPLWKKLKAVQKGQVYLINGYTWTGSNLLAADAVLDDIEKYLVNTP